MLTQPATFIDSQVRKVTLLNELTAIYVLKSCWGAFSKTTRAVNSCFHVWFKGTALTLAELHDSMLQG